MYWDIYKYREKCVYITKKGCQIIKMNKHLMTAPSIIKIGHQNCKMWFPRQIFAILVIFIWSVFIHSFSFFILQEDLPSKSFAFAKHFENTAFAWQWMGMWLQATTVSWMGHWKETVQSTDTVHGTCSAQWQNVERDTKTRFWLQTRSKF